MNSREIDLNCDLGENESSRRTKALMRYVTSANIACGGHAGNVQTMTLAVRAATHAGVRIGAHPGLVDRAGFGRAEANLSLEQFEILLLQQISALEKIVSSQGGQLHHVKLHGTLYHLTDLDTDFRYTYLAAILRFWPELIVFARAGGNTSRDAAGLGLQVWPEGFLDRAYLPDGTLVPRGNPGALLDETQFRKRLNCLSQKKQIIPAAVRTWCLHSDSPHALKFAREAKNFALASS